MANGGTRIRIVADATELIRDEGLHALSMRKLAARLGLSATALYRHFDSKEALVVAVCSEGFERFAAHLWRALDVESPLERLLETARQYRFFAEACPNYYRVMFMTPPELLGAVETSEKNQRRFDATFTFVVDRVAECLEAGELLPHDASALARGIWAQCHGLVALRLDGRFCQLDDEGFQRFYDEQLRSFLRGLRPLAHIAASEAALPEGRRDGSGSKTATAAS